MNTKIYIDDVRVVLSVCAIFVVTMLVSFYSGRNSKCGEIPVVKEKEKENIEIIQEVRYVSGKAWVLETEGWLSGKTVMTSWQLVYEDPESTRFGYFCCHIWTVVALNDSIKTAQHDYAVMRAKEYVDRKKINPEQ